MFGDRLLEFFDRVGQALRCIGGFVRVSKVDPQLVRIVDVAFAAFAERTLNQLVIGQFPFLFFLFQLRDGQVFALQSNILFAKFFSLSL